MNIPLIIGSSVSIFSIITASLFGIIELSQNYISQIRLLFKNHALKGSEHVRIDHDYVDTIDELFKLIKKLELYLL